MQIAGLSPLMQQGLLAALPRASAAFPASTLERDAPPIAPTVLPAAMPTTSVQMLVALAAAEPTIERRRKMAADADRGVTTLERLHRELVAGMPSPERLQALVEWSDQMVMPDQPALAALAREIDLRVRVELAKLDIEA